MKWMKFILPALIIAAVAFPAMFGMYAFRGQESAMPGCESSQHCHSTAAATDSTIPCAAHCLFSAREGTIALPFFIKMVLLAAAVTSMAGFILPILASEAELVLSRVPIPIRTEEILSTRKRE